MVSFVEIYVVWLVVEWCEVLLVVFGVVVFVVYVIGVGIVLGYLYE